MNYGRFHSPLLGDVANRQLLLKPKPQQLDAACRLWANLFGSLGLRREAPPPVPCRTPWKAGVISRLTELGESRQQSRFLGG